MYNPLAWKNFKTYLSHEVAKNCGCWNCFEPLVGLEHEESGYPDGAWRVRCPNCSMWNFYDVKEGK